MIISWDNSHGKSLKLKEVYKIIVITQVIYSIGG